MTQSNIPSIIDELTSRGMVEQNSAPAALNQLLNTQSITVYAGFDPTARSLHVGNLLPIMLLSHFQRAGHRPIALVGGATGMIGDPSGRSSERNLQTSAQVLDNLNNQRLQLQQFLDFDGSNTAQMVNNNDWIAPFSYIEWLRDVGKFFTVNYMLAKESVRSRLEDREQGISYTEFSYMLLQAYDFLHLYRQHQCQLQIGGNDQWGNITAGIELIRKVAGGTAYGVTCPLLTTSSGEKFGKSAGNAVWLDPTLTSPYEFYQYWMQAEDADVVRLLKIFTFLPLSEIESLAQSHAAQPEVRLGQKKLAAEVTQLVHGAAGLAKAQQASEVLFGREIQGLSDQDLALIFKDVPATEMPRALLDAGIGILDLLTQVGLCQSKGEAKRLVQGGGVYLNNQKISDGGFVLTPAGLASESMAVVRSGKKHYHLARFV